MEREKNRTIKNGGGNKKSLCKRRDNGVVVETKGTVGKTEEKKGKKKER